jgi:hypothetical protein
VIEISAVSLDHPLYLTEFSMVTTVGPAPSHNFVSEWAIEHGLRASGRWVEPEPAPEIDEPDAYPIADDQPADQTRVIKRDAVRVERMRSAVASVTGLDLGIEDEFELSSLDPTITGPQADPQPVANTESQPKVTAEAFREAKGIRVRDHSKLPPSKTTTGRREAHLRGLVKQGKYPDIETARANVKKRPGRTRYGREQAAKRRA